MAAGWKGEEGGFTYEMYKLPVLQFALDIGNHRRRINTKAIAAVWGEEFIKFLAKDNFNE